MPLLKDLMSEIYLSEDVIEWMEQKKSEYLSLLIQNQGADDISFADFHQYDHLISDTLTQPDWVSSVRDQKQIVKMYCKEHLKKDNIFQVVIGFIAEEKVDNEVFVPILSFVTKEHSLAEQFKSGEVKKVTLH